MGVGALGLAGISFDQYNVTFGQYLNAALHDAGDCFLHTIPVNATSAMFAGFQQATFDFALVDPGNFACLTVSLCTFVLDADWVMNKLQLTHPYAESIWGIASCVSSSCRGRRRHICSRGNCHCSGK